METKQYEKLNIILKGEKDKFIIFDNNEKDKGLNIKLCMKYIKKENNKKHLNYEDVNINLVIEEINVYGDNFFEMPMKTTINDNVKIHYNLFLEDGKKIKIPYDKNSFEIDELGYSNDLGYKDEKNKGTIIKGLDSLIMDLDLGDFVKVKIPYEYAYGENGIPYLIPSKTDLIYFLQITSIKRNDRIFLYLYQIDFTNENNKNIIKKYINNDEYVNNNLIFKNGSMLNNYFEIDKIEDEDDEDLENIIKKLFKNKKMYFLN